MSKPATTIYVWKFFIPPDKEKAAVDPDNPDLSWYGCMALACSATEDGARQALIRRAQQDGDDYRWLKVARVNRLDPVEGAFLAWVEF